MTNTQKPNTTVIDLNTAEGMTHHLGTLPTENLRSIAARPLCALNALLVVGAEMELIKREVTG